MRLRGRGGEHARAGHDACGHQNCNKLTHYRTPEITLSRGLQSEHRTESPLVGSRRRFDSIETAEDGQRNGIRIKNGARNSAEIRVRFRSKYEEINWQYLSESSGHLRRQNRPSCKPFARDAVEREGFWKDMQFFRNRRIDLQSPRLGKIAKIQRDRREARRRRRAARACSRCADRSAPRQAPADIVPWTSAQRPSMMRGSRGTVGEGNP